MRSDGRSVSSISKNIYKIQPSKLYDCDDFMILSKPPYWSCVQSANKNEAKNISQLINSEKEETIQDYVSITEYIPSNILQNDILEKVEKPNVSLVHRLDKSISGPVIVTKNSRCHSRLKKIFSLRLIEKEFVALVCGDVSSNCKILQQPENLVNDASLDTIKMEVLGHYWSFDGVTCYSLIKLILKGKSDTIRFKKNI
eukprot:GHVL01012136.1.p1 GENE.GHVL01012136.1~~GHVL01012136.1.p1  ORF type:complete len:220 (-),score=58.46 GHVL01012136.1:847-1443(-)